MTDGTFEYEVTRTGSLVALTLSNGTVRFSESADVNRPRDIDELLERAKRELPGLADDIDGRIRADVIGKATSDSDDVEEPLELPQRGPHGFSVAGLTGNRVEIDVCDSDDEVIFRDCFDPSKGHSLNLLFSRALSNGGIELTEDQRVEVSRWLAGMDLRDHAKQRQGENQLSDSPGTQAAELALAEAIELYRDDEDDRRGHADIPAGDTFRTVRIKSGESKRWVDHIYYGKYGAALSSESRTQAVNQLEAVAQFEGQHRRVFQRVAPTEGGVTIDLGDDSYRVVEVFPGGWRIVSEPPIRFWRSSSMRPLPEPVSGGDVDLLREAINVGDGEEGDRRFRLIVAFLLGSLSGRKPFPILILNGEQGSGKSTLSQVVRSLIDPRKAGLRQRPKEIRDLAIAGENGWLIAYDNLSGLPEWLSDGLCSLATGSGFGTRQLYTDDEERAFEQARPILINGIPDLASARPDLLDRALVLELPPLKTQVRRTEGELTKRWCSIAPRVFGGLLDALAAALKRLPQMERPEELPRMADFAMLVSAAEPSLGWQPGTILNDLLDVGATQREQAVSQDALAATLIRLLGQPDLLHGIERPSTEHYIASPTAWLNALSAVVGPVASKSQSWPKSPKALTDRLKRLAPALRELGIEIEHGIWHKGARALSVRVTG